MRIKFNTSISGLNFSHSKGDEVEWKDEKDAMRLIAAGYATQVKDPTEGRRTPETATAPASPENASNPPPPPQEPAQTSENATTNRATGKKKVKTQGQ